MANTHQETIYQTKVIGTSEFAVNANIAIDLEKPLMKVLAVNCVADLTNTESVDADFSMGGKTQINVVYLTESGMVESVSGVADWQNSAKVSGESKLAKVSVAECQVERFSATEVVVSVLHHALIWGTTNAELETIGELDDNYIVDKKVVVLNQPMATGAEKFVVADNTELAVSNAEVISCEPNVLVKNVLSGIDQVTIEGEINIKLLYSAEGNYNTITKKIDFRQEVGCLHALPGALASAIVTIASTTATAEIGEKTNFVVAVGLDAKVTSYTETTLQLVNDMFNLKKEIATTNQCVECLNYSGSKDYTDTFSCVVSLDANGVDEVVSTVCPSVSIARSAIEGGKLVVEGVLSSTLIYKDNEQATVNSLPLNCPFVSSVDCSNGDTIDSLVVTGDVTSVKVRSGKEAEVVFDICVQANCSESKYFEYISSVTEGEDRQPDESAISIYVTKEGETLFEVARALKVDPQVIAGQNEMDANTFSAGQRIFVYNPLNVEF